MHKSAVTAVIVLLTLLIPLNIYPQQDNIKQKKTPEERAENISSKLQLKLELTNEQKQAVYDALLETFRQGETDRELYKDDKEARMKAAELRFEKLDSRFKEIFTPEQYLEFESLKQKMIEKRKNKMKSKPPDKKTELG